jgi:hypothetical protein
MRYTGLAACSQGTLALLRDGNLDTGRSEEKLKNLVIHLVKGSNSVKFRMFLDVATVLHGRSCSLAKNVWSAWHGVQAFQYFQELQNGCLLFVDANQRLAMHDVLSCVGRGMILDEGNWYYGSRIWVKTDESMKVQLCGRVVSSIKSL